MRIIVAGDRRWQEFFVSDGDVVIAAGYCRALIVAGSDNHDPTGSFAFLAEAGAFRSFR
jgi:hypothetical protein